MQEQEKQRKRENMDKLRKDMEKSKGETVVLNAPRLKDAKKIMDEYDEEEDENIETFSNDEDDDDDGGIDEDEDEEVASFRF